MYDMDVNEKPQAMNTKSLPLLFSLLVMPAAVSVVLLPTTQAEAQVTVAQTDAAELLEEANRLLEQGIEQFSVSQFQEAFQSYQQALELYQDPTVQTEFPQESRLGEGRTRHNAGLIYAAQGEYQRAIEGYEQSLAIFRELDDRLREGIALGNLRIAYADLGQYQEAIARSEQALVILREIGDRQGEGNALGNLAIAYADLGQYQEAIARSEQALVIFREIGDRRGEGRALGNLGNAYNRLDQYQEAIALYEQSLDIVREIGDRASEGRTLGSLGSAYHSLGQYQEAIARSEQALVILREIGDRQGEGGTLGNLGIAYANLGQYQEAITFHEQHLDIAREIGDRRSEGNALGNLGIAYDNLGQYQEAIALYEQRLVIAREIGDRRGEGSALGSLGTAYHSLGQYQEAIARSEQHLVIAREVGDRRGEGLALGNLGDAYRNLGQHQEAIALYEQVLVITREIGDRRSEGIALNNLGLAYLSSEQYPQSTETLFAAIEVLESLRDADIPDAQRITFFDTQSSSYRVLQRSLIAQGETEQALAISERGRARAFVSSLAERQNQDAPALPPPSIPDIQRTAQAQNATLVQYSRASFGDGVSQLYIWVIQPTGEITFRSVDLSGLDTTLSDFITTGRDAIGLRSRNNDAIIEVALTPEALRTRTERQRRILQDLHTLLIDPIADLLPTDPDAPVIIIPHQELFLVPFAALVDANGDYLIQHHTLLTAPSIQVLQLLGEQQTTTAAGDPLIIGNPIMPSIWNPATGEEETLSSLPGAEAEAVAIAEVFNTEPLLWEQASETTVTRRMATAPLLHFATHGLLDYGEPTATGVRDFPGAIALAAGEGNDGLLTSAEIFDLTLSAELVVLSACDTGRGRITGDGVIGLSRAFIQAGVPQVLVSLWAVPDAPTAELMTTFYQQRDLTDTDAQALRQAMLITLQTHPNPRDWAAFTLIGGAQ